MSDTEMTCVVCGDAFERPDMAACTFHNGVICSLCCSLDSCKKTASGPVNLGIPAVA